MDYYVTNRQPGGDEILHEMLQREAILQRWKHNGMTPDDVGILSDTDETFTRDFLLALQTCDVPEFRPERNCKAPKVVGRTLILEATPDCVVTAAERVWYHPGTPYHIRRGICDDDYQFEHKIIYLLILTFSHSFSW